MRSSLAWDDYWKICPRCEAARCRSMITGPARSRKRWRYAAGQICMGEFRGRAWWHYPPNLSASRRSTRWIRFWQFSVRGLQCRCWAERRLPADAETMPCGGKKSGRTAYPLRWSRPEGIVRVLLSASPDQVSLIAVRQYWLEVEVGGQVANSIFQPNSQQYW